MTGRRRWKGKAGRGEKKKAWKLKDGERRVRGEEREEGGRRWRINSLSVAQLSHMLVIHFHTKHTLKGSRKQTDRLKLRVYVFICGCSGGGGLGQTIDGVYDFTIWPLEKVTEGLRGWWLCPQNIETHTVCWFFTHMPRYSDVSLFFPPYFPLFFLLLMMILIIN